jgi:hypothetical protein
MRESWTSRGATALEHSPAWPAALLQRVVLVLVMLMAGLSLARAEPPSPLECGLKQTGLKTHIECQVTRDSVSIKSVIANDGACQTQQDYYDKNPKELDKLVKSSGLQPQSFQYRKTYRSGQTFLVYMMPCNLGTYTIETNLGTWTWIAQRM